MAMSIMAQTKSYLQTESRRAVQFTAGESVLMCDGSQITISV